MTHTGIFLCTCDRKIDKGVDVERVGGAFSGEAVVRRAENLCLPEGIQTLQREIIENNLDHVVVAACPGRFQRKHLQDACVEAGVNLNRFTLVDWREGCAWTHRGDKEGATTQAIDLVTMGLARVTEAFPLDGVMTKIAPRALVVGGGIAGMTAARALADRGVQVILVEREAELGGGLSSVPLNGHGQTYEATLDEVLQSPAVHVRLGSRVVDVRGSVGNYIIEIAGPSGAEKSQVYVGAVVIATGACEFRDSRLFRYDGRKILTLGDFEKQINHGGTPFDWHSPEGTLSSASVPNRSLIYILCAGSRDGHIPYCSNTCCLGALGQAIRVKRASPVTDVRILFRDLYLLGDELNEEVVREARRAGIEFVRYAESAPPRVEDEFVVVRDAAGITRWIGYDRVVLATPQVPREDAASVARLFGLARDEYGFFPDTHWRLRPEDQAERGVFVGGSAHRPVDVDTAVMQGLTAAARAARFIQKREVMRPANSASVDEKLCTGCAQCVNTCPVGAIRLDDGDGQARREAESKKVESGKPAAGIGVRSVIDPFLCVACGNCLPACPSKAIDLPAFSDAMIFAQIDAALMYQGGTADQLLGETGALSASPNPRVLAFGCQWSGIAAMELAGARRLKYPANVRVIELPCSARLDPMHVLYALIGGAQVVLLALCPPNECHFGNGNSSAETRVEQLRAELKAHGIDPKRLQVARMMGDDAGAWVRAVEAAAADSNRRFAS